MTLGVRNFRAARADGKREDPKNRRIEGRRITLQASGRRPCGPATQRGPDPETQAPFDREVFVFLDQGLAGPRVARAPAPRLSAKEIPLFSIPFLPFLPFLL